MTNRRILDRKRPYSEVYGLPGAVYEQDNIMFNHSGTEVFEKELQPIVEEIRPVEDENVIIRPAEVAESSPEPKNVNKTIEKASDKALRAMVESYGGTYENRKQAIDYLSGNRAA